MNRLRAINTLKDGPAMTGLDAAIEVIREHQERWHHTNEPEETAFTKGILGALIDLQVNSVARAVRMGEAMSRRLCAANDDDTPDTDPSGSALAVPVSMEAAA